MRPCTRYSFAHTYPQPFIVLSTYNIIYTIFLLKAYHDDGGTMYDCRASSTANSLLHISCSFPCRQQGLPGRPRYQRSCQRSCQRQQCHLLFCFASGLLLVSVGTSTVYVDPPPPLILSWIVDTLARQTIFISQRSGERRSYPEGSGAA